MEQEEHAGLPAPIGIEALQLQAQDEIETRQVLTRFGYEGTLEQVIGETRMRMRRSTEDLVEIGRAVLAFRELPRRGYDVDQRASQQRRRTTGRIFVT